MITGSNGGGVHQQQQHLYLNQLPDFGKDQSSASKRRDIFFGCNKTSVIRVISKIQKKKIKISLLGYIRRR